MITTGMIRTGSWDPPGGRISSIWLLVHPCRWDISASFINPISIGGWYHIGVFLFRFGADSHKLHGNLLVFDQSLIGPTKRKRTPGS